MASVRNTTLVNFATSNNRIGRELQGGNPFRLIVLGYIEVSSMSEAGTKEKSLHCKFKVLSHVEHLSPENYPENKLPSKSEWFRKSTELIEYIEITYKKVFREKTYEHPFPTQHFILRRLLRHHG